MGNFMGGSAPAMAAQIGDGFILLSASTIRGFAPSELTLLRLEIDKLLREARAIVPPQDDAHACQTRNRRIGRLSSALQVLSNTLVSRR
ncbi:MAG: hypothetical protein JXO72_08670 [Vicinamibacteria bacterium]|nr:hypothetical protein [Vicinamibacteria bacterium]